MRVNHLSLISFEQNFNCFEATFSYYSKTRKPWKNLIFLSFVLRLSQMDFCVHISLFVVAYNVITLFKCFFRDFCGFRDFRGFNLTV